jgi:hypothetical protein
MPVQFNALPKQMAGVTKENGRIFRQSGSRCHRAEIINSGLSEYDVELSDFRTPLSVSRKYEQQERGNLNYINHLE